MRYEDCAEMILTIPIKPYENVGVSDIACDQVQKMICNLELDERVAKRRQKEKELAQ